MSTKKEDSVSGSPAVPRCIGVIMDGNRRWAKKKGLLHVEGHRAGKETCVEVIKWAGAVGVTHLIFYTFSTENWRRSHEEVSYLLDLFRASAREFGEELSKQEVRVRFVGDLTRFPQDIQDEMRSLEEQTSSYSKGTVAFAVSYGGRAELLAAIERVRTENSIDEETVSRALWTHDLPDPDMIIRTGGQKRLSNFLTWQSVYSELFFTDTLWPDLSKREFEEMLADFAERKRNFGM